MIQKFEFLPTKFEGAYLIKPFVATDERGSFIKDYSQEVFVQNGIKHDLKEVFYTVSQKGVIRALHFQRVKQQAKLVRCVSGKILDAIVDLRPESKTFKQWQSFELSDENNLCLYVPEYFAHGYLVLEPSIVSYKCNEKFYGEYDDGIRWDDPDIGVSWPINQVDKIILSAKDQKLQSFEEYLHNVKEY